MKTILCVVCRTDPASTRDLCLYCYSRYRYRGRHTEFPRKTWPAAELTREADILLDRGCSPTEVARQLGVQWDTITTARRRLRQRAVLREGEKK